MSFSGSNTDTTTTGLFVSSYHYFWTAKFDLWMYSLKDRYLRSAVIYGTIKNSPSRFLSSLYRFFSFSFSLFNYFSFSFSSRFLFSNYFFSICSFFSFLSKPSLLILGPTSTMQYSLSPISFNFAIRLFSVTLLSYKPITLSSSRLT